MASSIILILLTKSKQNAKPHSRNHSSFRASMTSNLQKRSTKTTYLRVYTSIETGSISGEKPFTSTSSKMTTTNCDNTIYPIAQLNSFYSDPKYSCDQNFIKLQCMSLPTLIKSVKFLTEIKESKEHVSESHLIDCDIRNMHNRPFPHGAPTQPAL